MDNESNHTNTKAISDRLDKIERDIQDLNRRVATFDVRPAGFAPASALKASPPPSPYRQIPPTPTQVQVFCPNCHGGNPPDARICMWCRRPLPSTSSLPSSLPSPSPTPSPSVPRPQSSVLDQLPSFDFLTRSEFWLNKVGIALLLLGVAFFFKYSIDKGWLNEPVRVVLGLALGTVLLGFGVALHPRRRAFSQVLLGGSIATYYITGYAAYQLFQLVPYEVAFGFMALVTALAFVLAVGQDQAILSLIGVAGGLLTPFVLTAPSAGVVGFVTYICVVLAGASAIYLFRGWRSLLWVSYVGGWVAFLAGYFAARGSEISSGGILLDYRWALQIGALFSFLVFWALPMLREVLYQRNPTRWPSPSLANVAWLKNLADGPNISLRMVHLLTVVTPLVALGYSRLVWGDLVSRPQWGWITLAGAALFGLVAWLLRRALPALAYTHALMGILLGTLGIVQILEGNALIFALAVEAVALHFVSKRLSDNGTAVYGHIISTLVFTWVGSRLMVDLVAEHRLDGSSLTNLAVIAALAASSFVVRPRDLAPIYRTFVHMGVMGWLFSQLYGLSNWSGLVMLAWAAYALCLYALYWRMPTRFGWQDMPIASHVVFASAALIFAWRVENVVRSSDQLAVFNVNALMDVILVALVAGVSFIVVPKEVALWYRIAAHLGALALVWRELSGLENGNAYVSIAWGAYAIALLVAGLRTEHLGLSEEAHAPLDSRHSALVYIGIATLLLVVAKLFLVDLVALDPLWRVLLFVGFGGIFLLLSYFFQNLMGGQKREARNEK